MFQKIWLGEEKMQQKIRKIFLSVLPFFAVFIPILLGVPQSAQALERRRLIPVGRTVGVTMDTEGLLVLETGSVVGADNESHEPSKGLLKAGDRILQANGEKQENKEAFMKTIQQSEGKPICLRLERNGRQKEVKITPVLSNTAQTYQIGAWIRDSIQGIGTVTYYDAENGTFGALGHGVVKCISRIARNTRDLLSIVSELMEKGVEFVSLKENIDTTTPQGRFMLTVFGALAELERQREGIEIAKSEGKYKGRKPIDCNEAQMKALCKKWRAGEITATAAMKELGLKPNTFYRRVKEMRL